MKLRFIICMNAMLILLSAGVSKADDNLVVLSQTCKWLKDHNLLRDDGVFSIRDTYKQNMSIDGRCGGPHAYINIYARLGSPDYDLGTSRKLAVTILGKPGWNNWVQFVHREKDYMGKVTVYQDLRSGQMSGGFPFMLQPSEAQIKYSPNGIELVSRITVSGTIYDHVKKIQYPLDDEILVHLSIGGKDRVDFTSDARSFFLRW